MNVCNDFVSITVSVGQYYWVHIDAGVRTNRVGQMTAWLSVSRSVPATPGNTDLGYDFLGEIQQARKNIYTDFLLEETTT